MYGSNVYNRIIDLLSNPRTSAWIHPLLLIADAGLTSTVIKKVPYTEIDFTTYMQQVQLVIYGMRDYKKIAGSTGPLVYPALHVYIYSFLWWICRRGQEIIRAQIIFSALYLVGLHFAIKAYRRVEAPPWLLPLLVLSKRLHSIFVLRLFNDCFAAVLLWLAILSYQKKRWRLGSAIFSLGVGVKMTLLLAFPGILVVLGTALPVGEAFEVVMLIVGIQVIIGAPFIGKSFESYVGRAFEFSRTFLFKWTVNWRFIGQKMFLSQGFAETLLAVHILLLAWFVLTRWLRPSGLSILDHVQRLWKGLPANIQHRMSSRLSPNVVTTIILTSLAIGMLCARSLHYQFFAYLAWTTPFLLWKANFHPVLIYGVWAAQEWAWNVYPSTNTSSKMVVGSLALQVLGVWWGTRAEFRGIETSGSRRTAKARKTT